MASDSQGRPLDADGYPIERGIPYPVRLDRLADPRPHPERCPCRDCILTRRARNGWD